MRRRLNLTPRAATATPMNLVLRAREGAVSLVVDEIGDVLELAVDNSEPPPATLKPEIREITDCIFKLHGTLLLALSAGRLLQSLCDAVITFEEKSC
jgi:purine-binding chemotaxis protein CheW